MREVAAHVEVSIYWHRVTRWHAARFEVAGACGFIGLPVKVGAIAGIFQISCLVSHFTPEGLTLWRGTLLRNPLLCWAPGRWPQCQSCSHEPRKWRTKAQTSILAPGLRRAGTAWEERSTASFRWGSWNASCQDAQLVQVVNLLSNFAVGEVSRFIGFNWREARHFQISAEIQWNIQKWRSWAQK